MSYQSVKSEALLRKMGTIWSILRLTLMVEFSLRLGLILTFSSSALQIFWFSEWSLLEMQLSTLISSCSESYLFFTFSKITLSCTFSFL